MKKAEEKIIIYLGDNPKNIFQAKTANCLIQFALEKVAGILVVDKSKLSNCAFLNQYRDMHIPIYDESDLTRLDTMYKIVIGIAPVGGGLGVNDTRMMEVLLEKGFIIINTLHVDIGNGHENVVNYRKNSVENKVATGRITHAGKRILFVGTDFSIGKMTATLALFRAMKEEGYCVDWLPTGQTGKLLKEDKGLVLDTMVIDFVPGNLEYAINQQEADILLIEGQGSIFHPSYSPTSFGLLHASQPHYLILCDNPTMKIGHLGNELPSISEAIEFYEQLSVSLGLSAKVIGVALLVVRDKTEGLCSIIDQAYSFFNVMMGWIAKILPVFIYCTLVNILMENGDIQVMNFAFLVIVSLLLMAMFLLTRFVSVVYLCKMSPRLLFKKLWPSFILLLTAASSTATFGDTKKVCVEKLGVEESCTSTSLPLGSVLYMPACVILFTASALYCASLYGTNVSISFFVLLVFLSVIMTMAMPPVGGSEIMCLTGLFMGLGIDTAGVPLIVALTVVVNAFLVVFNIVSLELTLVLNARKLGELNEDILHKEI